MTVATISPRDALRIVKQAMKDQRYKATPLGPMVGRYMRWLRNEYGATPSTLRDYEGILARMCLYLDSHELIEVTTEDLREVIDLWRDQTARTRQKVTSVIRSFWFWCDEQGHIAVNPAQRIRRPRAERKVARTLPKDARSRLFHAATSPRDRVALHCLLSLGVRRSELAGIRMRDFDIGRGTVRVFGKGQKERVLPMPELMRDEVGLMLNSHLPLTKRLAEGDDYLLYPAKTFAAGRGIEGEQIRKRVADPKKPMSGPSVHRWWYALAADAGLATGTSGLNMHQARHTLAMEMRRTSGIEGVSNVLGHSDLSTTLGIYGHFDANDLRSAVAAHEAWVRDQEDDRDDE